MSFVRVVTDEVEAELVGVRSGQDVAAARESFQIEELVIFEAMHGFDVALVGVRGWRNAHALADARGEDRAGDDTALLGKGPEEQGAAHLAGRVLHWEETQALRMRPEVRDIAEILRVGGVLLEPPPGGFDGGEVLFALIFSATLANQPVGMPDALEDHVTDGQIKLALHSGGAEGGEFATQSHDLLLDLAGGFLRGMMRGTAVFLQSGGACCW